MQTCAPSDPPTLDLCCGGRKCPKITRNPDGSGLIVDEEAGYRSELTREQMDQLRAWATALPTE